MGKGPGVIFSEDGSARIENCYAVNLGTPPWVATKYFYNPRIENGVMVSGRAFDSLEELQEYKAGRRIAEMGNPNPTPASDHQST